MDTKYKIKVIRSFSFEFEEICQYLTNDLDAQNAGYDLSAAIEDSVDRAAENHEGVVQILRHEVERHVDGRHEIFVPAELCCQMMLQKR